MRGVFITLFLTAAMIARLTQPLRAQEIAKSAKGNVSSVTLQPILTPSNDRLDDLEKRLEEMDRRHKQESSRMQQRIEELEGQLKKAGSKPAAQLGLPQKPLTHEQEAEQEVERMLREAMDKKRPDPTKQATTGTPQEQVESAIEQMLRQAEQEPATPRPAGGLSVLNPKITILGDFLGRISSLPDKYSPSRGIQDRKSVV